MSVSARKLCAMSPYPETFRIKIV